MLGGAAGVMVVRPSRMTAAEQRDSVVRARTILGTQAERTTDLVVGPAQTEAHGGGYDQLASPVDLVKYGEVIYWSNAAR